MRRIVGKSFYFSLKVKERKPDPIPISIGITKGYAIKKVKEIAECVKDSH
jgi:hypothetical protein